MMHPTTSKISSSESEDEQTLPQIGTLQQSYLCPLLFTDEGDILIPDIWPEIATEDMTQPHRKVLILRAVKKFLSSSTNGIPIR